MSTADLLLRGVVVGVLAAYLVLYGLRPSSPYPKWMLAAYDQPWVFIVLFIVVVQVAMWDLFAGCLAMIGFLAFTADLFVFGNHGLRAEEASSEAAKKIGDENVAGAAETVGYGGWAPVGAVGADAGSALSRVVVAPGVEPAYSLYPMFEDSFSGERLGGPAAF